MFGVELVISSSLVRETLQVGCGLCAILLLSGRGDAADHPAFEPVKQLFAAMSRQDGQAMRANSTADFQLLEHGEDWTMQELIDAVQPKGQPYERKNYFSQIRARHAGDVAWVSYWNKAEIRRESGLRTIVWLESAVLVREDGRWKIQLLHSTRLESDKHPKNIDWVQFVGSP